MSKDQPSPSSSFGFPAGIMGPKAGGGPSSQVRNVGRQCGASDGGYSQTLGFQKIDRAKTHRASEESLEAGKSGGPADRLHERSGPEVRARQRV